MQIRDAWFPNEEKPMPLDEFIYVLCCHIIYNKLKENDKVEYKYLWESEATKVENLIDINGKNTHHPRPICRSKKEG